MYADIESNDSRLHDALGLLESHSYKRSMNEINKLLKKNPRSPSANALKAINLLRNGKCSESFEVMGSIMKENYNDRDTLNFMTMYFREINKENMLEAYVLNALKQFPNDENLLECLFYVHVRSGNFDAQQSAARKLSQLKPEKRVYQLFLIVSTILQGEKNEEMAKRMFLPLADKMLEKALKKKILTSHKDLQLYISILKRLEKYEEVLQLLTDKELIAEINEADFPQDYADDFIELYSALDSWSEIVRISKEMLAQNHDNWTAWRALLQHGFDDDERRKALNAIIEEYVQKSPNSRGPALAKIDYSANLIKRSIDVPKVKESFCIDLAKTYFDTHGRKPVGALDLAYTLPLLITSDKSRHLVVESFLKDARSKECDSSCSDEDQAYYAVNAFRIARCNGTPFSLFDLVSIYQSHATKPPQPGRDLTKEMAPADGLLQLAVSELLSPVCGVSDDSDNACGRLLLAAHWIHEVGLEHSPANHFMRLQLVRILSPNGGLACCGRQLVEFAAMDVKEILLVSLGHLQIAPGPQLTIYGNRLPARIHPGQQYDNLIDVYEMFVKKVQSMRREVENWMVSCYRRQALSRIPEYARFLSNVCHSETLLVAQSELIYNQVLVDSNNFDEALERMSVNGGEVAAIKSLLTNICDLRDFTVLPDFSSQKPDELNKKRSFDHLRDWVKLRLDLVEVFGACSKLIMKAVPCIDRINNAELSAESQKDINELLDNVKIHLASLVPMKDGTKLISSNFSYTDLVLSAEDVLTPLLPLPKTNMLSFYLNGPFLQTLKAGINTLVHVASVLLDRNPKPDKCVELNQFCDALSQLTGDHPGLPTLPSPPKEGAPLESLANPGSALVALGVAVETLSIAVLFITAAIAMLRPRRFVYQPLNKKRTNKKRNHDGEKSEAGEKAIPNAGAKYFDEVARIIGSVTIPKLNAVAEKLRDLASQWCIWATKEAVGAFVSIAVKAAHASFKPVPTNEKSFQWLPELGERSSKIFCDIAEDFACGFKELSRVCENKHRALTAALTEVECFMTASSMASLSLEDANQ